MIVDFFSTDAASTSSTTAKIYGFPLLYKDYFNDKFIEETTHISHCWLFILQEFYYTSIVHRSSYPEGSKTDENKTVF